MFKKVLSPVQEYEDFIMIINYKENIKNDI